MLQCRIPTNFDYMVHGNFMQLTYDDAIQDHDGNLNLLGGL